MLIKLALLILMDAVKDAPELIADVQALEAKLAGKPAPATVPVATQVATVASQAAEAGEKSVTDQADETPAEIVAEVAQVICPACQKVLVANSPDNCNCPPPAPTPDPALN